MVLVLAQLVSRAALWTTAAALVTTAKSVWSSYRAGVDAGVIAKKEKTMISVSAAVMEDFLCGAVVAADG